MPDEHIDVELLLNILQGKERFYNFLSEVFLRQPDAGQVRMFTEAAPALSAFAGGLGGGDAVGESLETAALKISQMTPEEFDDYVAECNKAYSAVFYVGKTVPVTESNYLSSGGLSNDENIDMVLTAYSQTGYKPEISGSNEPADHIGFELGFLADVCAKTAKCLRSGNEEEAEKGFAVQFNFLNSHLNLWLGRLCDAVAAREHGGYYFFLLIRVLKLFVKEDYDMLKDIVENNK